MTTNPMGRWDDYQEFTKSLFIKSYLEKVYVKGITSSHALMINERDTGTINPIIPVLVDFEAENGSLFSLFRNQFRSIWNQFHCSLPFKGGTGEQVETGTGRPPSILSSGRRPARTERGTQVDNPLAKCPFLRGIHPLGVAKCPFLQGYYGTDVAKSPFLKGSAGMVFTGGAA